MPYSKAWSILQQLAPCSLHADCTLLVVHIITTHPSNHHHLLRVELLAVAKPAVNEDGIGAGDLAEDLAVDGAPLEPEVLDVAVVLLRAPLVEVFFSFLLSSKTRFYVLANSVSMFILG